MRRISSRTRGKGGKDARRARFRAKMMRKQEGGWQVLPSRRGDVGMLDWKVADNSLDGRQWVMIRPCQFFNGSRRRVFGEASCSLQVHRDERPDRCFGKGVCARQRTWVQYVCLIVDALPSVFPLDGSVVHAEGVTLRWYAGKPPCLFLLRARSGSWMWTTTSRCRLQHCHAPPPPPTSKRAVGGDSFNGDPST